MAYVFYYRHPRTLNEMWQYESTLINELDINVKIRCRRKPNRLPNSWDDIYKERKRSWKNYRKTQWRNTKSL